MVKLFDMKSNVDETIKLYSGMGWKSLFSKIRFWDAPFLEVEKIVPQNGVILDLGCGEGIFTNYLGICSNKRKITAIDIDKQRIKEANRGLKNVTFKYGDVTKFDVPKVDTIIMFHLLHHLKSFSDQGKVISECVKKLNKDGKLIIVEVEPKFSYKYLLAYFTDHFLVPWIFERRFYCPVYFRRTNDWIELFRSFGLSCKVFSADKGKPFSHIIFEASPIL